VAEILGVRLSGFPAWWLWRTVYLLKSPAWSRRVKLAFDWTWELMFPRDLGHARTNQTERVTRAHYRPGDDIFLEGSPGTHFYVIDRGEVEFIRRDHMGQPNQILACWVPVNSSVKWRSSTINHEESQPEPARRWTSWSWERTCFQEFLALWHPFASVTRSELFGAFEQGRGPATKVEDFMLDNPMMVTPDQSPLAVAELMHKHDVDWIPVVENKESRRLIGVIRSERMLRSLVAQVVDG